MKIKTIENMNDMPIILSIINKSGTIFHGKVMLDDDVAFVDMDNIRNVNSYMDNVSKQYHVTIEV